MRITIAKRCDYALPGTGHLTTETRQLSRVHNAALSQAWRREVEMERQNRDRCAGDERPELAGFGYLARCVATRSQWRKSCRRMTRKAKCS